MLYSQYRSCGVQVFLGMGVAWVFQVSATQQQVDSHMRSQGAADIIPFSVDFSLYRHSKPLNPGKLVALEPVDEMAKEGVIPMCLLYHSRFPSSAYTIGILEKLSYSAAPKITTDRGIGAILAKMNTELEIDSSSQYEVKGSEYKFADFYVRCGTVTHVLSSTTCGVTVEVEYAPSILVTQSLPAITEFIARYFPKERAFKWDVLCKNYPDRYNPIETVYQYMVSGEGGDSWRLFLEHIDDLRFRLNSVCVHLEAWQVASYTLSMVFFILYILELASSEKPLGERIRARVFHLLRTLPWVHTRLVEDLAKAKKEIEEEVHEMDNTRDFYKFLPERPFSRDDILAEASLYAAMGGARSKLRSLADPSTREDKALIASQVGSLFGWTDSRCYSSFPGARKMESEVVRMCVSLLHGGSNSAGIVVPSAAEATLVALCSARASALRAGIRTPSIVASTAAAPSLFHAANILGMRVKEVKAKRDGSVETGAVKRAIRSDTAIIFLSSPNLATGTSDPIEAIAKMAQRYSIPLHVDCSLGGFVLPFMELADYSIPSFDFRLPGVASISIDLSRCGQSPTSCALTLFRDQNMLKRSVFVNPLWPGGIYASASLSDSLDGSTIAAAWATLLATGRSGFVEATCRLVEGTRRLAQALSQLEGIQILGSADTVVVAFETARPEDIYHVIDVMKSKGWPLEPLVSPPSARLLMSLEMAEDNNSASFLSDLETCLSQLGATPSLADGSSSRAFHLFVRTAPDRWVVDELTRERVLAHYSMPAPVERRSMRTLSVEGRKISMMSAHTELVERRKATANDK